MIYYGNLVTATEKSFPVDWPEFEIFTELDKGITVDTQFI